MSAMSPKFQLRGTAAYHVSERRLCPSELADTKAGVLPNRHSIHAEQTGWPTFFSFSLTDHF